MQITKIFFLNVKRQNATLIIYLGVFITLLLLFTNNGRSQRETVFESSRLNMIIQDYDQSTLSQNLFQYLSGIHHVKEKNYTKEQIADELYYENVDYVLTIPKGFEENLKNGVNKNILENRKRQGSTSGYFVDAQIDQYLSLLNSYLASGYTQEETAISVGRAVAKEADITLLTSGKQEKNPNLYFAFCYMPYILICILTVGLGMILITLREENISKRISCSSLSVICRNLQLVFSSIIFSLIYWFLLLLVALLTLQVNIFNVQGFLYVLNSFLFLLVAISITFLISFLVHSTGSLNMIANVVGLGLSFLGGVYVPLQYMNKSVVLFARLLPSYWYIITLDHIEDYAGKTSQLKTILSCMGIEFLFAIAILCAALVISRQKKIQ